MTEIGARSAVVVILLPPVAALLWLGGWWSAALFAIGAAIASREYLRLAVPAGGPSVWLAIAGTAGLTLGPMLAPSDPAAFFYLLVVGLAMALWGYHLAFGPRPEAPVRIGHMLAAVIFIGGGLFALAVLRAGPAGLGWAAVVLAGSWGNDTAAYFTGRSIGRHKLLPAVSPGKTWEGFVGGLAGGVAALVVLRGALLPGLTVPDCLLLGLLMGLCGPVGDLSKSMLKRAYHVKDMGRILPGHGGVLDRIDAVLFNAPAVLAYCWLAAA